MVKIFRRVKDWIEEHLIATGIHVFSTLKSAWRYGYDLGAKKKKDLYTKKDYENSEE
jgi:hypothetical protein